MSGLSVLTLVKNRPDHLRRLVEGLCRSDDQPLELIIVDMSDDPIAPTATAFPTRLCRLKTDSLPLAAARNLAAQEAAGEMLLFLDVDCIPKHNLVGAMTRSLARHDALICAEVRYLRPGQINEHWTEAALHQNSTPHPVRDFPVEGLRQEPNPGLFWSLAFGIRRGLFNELGGFDETFTGYGAEDTDFGFRTHAAGIDLLFLGGTGAFHQYHDVYDPPLQHFDDILRNAQLFYDRWSVWPMEGWLRAFTDLSLIEISDHKIERRRSPTREEVKASFVQPLS